MEGFVVDFEQLRIIGAIADATADGQRFVVVPVIVTGIDFGFPQINGAVKQKLNNFVFNNFLQTNKIHRQPSVCFHYSLVEL